MYTFKGLRLANKIAKYQTMRKLKTATPQTI